MIIAKIKTQLDELEMTARDISVGAVCGEAAGLKVMQNVQRIREYLPAPRGGWKNPASAANGRKGGRPKKTANTR